MSLPFSSSIPAEDPLKLDECRCEPTRMARMRGARRMRTPHASMARMRGTQHRARRVRTPHASMARMRGTQHRACRVRTPPERMQGRRALCAAADEEGHQAEGHHDARSV
jgi:hypothetical protein